MRAKIKLFGPFAFSVLLILGSGIFTFGANTPAQTLNLPEAGDVMLTDDEQPEVTDRVARVSYLKGNAKIRRAGATEWENVTLNLPLVEGDEIATDKETRLEIQFDNYRHVRLNENSYLKLTTLRDEGIALSLSLGTMNARLSKFDKDKFFFEIDAPKTTIAIQKSGSYRIDAGEDRSSEIRVSALNGGEARVYSDSSGFTLKNGRSTRVFIDGANVGEWETSDAIRFQDDFDTWTLDRDDVIARRINDAYYDRYYDNDIYGADDLNAHGDWVYLRNYGYVWRPSRNAISGYADWSPYRYGHWRWMQPYGWIWVNDEPWGWATYHHGRWFYDAGYWYWSPYGYYRPRRSWWFPALVVINIFHSDVYWYPASYHYSFRDCRWRYYRHYNNNNNNHHGGNGGPIRTPSPTPIHPPTNPQVAFPQANSPKRLAELAAIPPTGVVTTKYNEFGTTKSGGIRPPLAVANNVLSIKTSKSDVPELPVGATIRTKMDHDIVTQKPALEFKQAQVKVGATVRTTAAPLDNELRNTKVLGGRPQKAQGDAGGVVNNTQTTKSDMRDTGAVIRDQPTKSEQAPVKQPPIFAPSQPPSETKTPRNNTRKREESPTYSPPPKRDDSPPTRYEPPKYNPPPPPPTKHDPPPKRDDPPPTKKPESKPQ